MWFKTRVSLVAVLEPMEIRVASYPEEKIPYHLVFAECTKDQSFEYKGIFGKAKARNHYINLARFHISNETPSRIAECMKRVEEAICADVKVCDLSTVGDRDAWSDAWTQIEWRP